MAILGDRDRARTVVLLLLLVAPTRAADEANTLRDGFEGDKTAWRQEKTDAEVRLFAHDRSDRAAREGTRSERFQFDAAVGGGFYFSYALPKVPLADDLRVGLNVRSDRSGVQVLGRVILPADTDPETNQPSYVLVPGTILADADRWTRLELLDLPRSVERQARVVRAASKRPVSLEGAYLDRLVINLYGGPGPTEVFLDDLRVSPVPALLTKAHARGLSGDEKAATLPPLPNPPRAVADADAVGEADRGGETPAGSRFKNERSGLRQDGYPWFPMIVRAPGADRGKLYDHGFDALALPADSEPEDVEAAAKIGFALMPEFEPSRGAVGLDPALVAQGFDKFPSKASVAFVSLGESLGGSVDLKARLVERDRAREVARLLRKRTDGSGLSTAGVTGLLTDYARVPENLDLIGIRPSGWGTIQEPGETFQFLQQRRYLTALENADALIYSWIPLAPDPVFRTAVWGKDTPPSWGVPRVQPEQLRLSAYLAIAAGCRGLAFDAGPEITAGAGRPLLIESAFLNEEIDLFEWLLADTSKSLDILRTFLPDPDLQAPGAAGLGSRSNTKPVKEFGPHPSIKAAVFGTKDRRGKVLFVADHANAGQFQPPQMAFRKLQIDVPGVPVNAEAYLISPGDVEVLNRKRVPGGLRIQVPEFGPTAIVYVTTDGARVAEIQRRVMKARPVAVNLIIEQAALLFASTSEVHRLLVDDGHTMAEGEQLLSLASETIKSAREAQERQDYALAWNEARRANRPLAILMRYQWDKALEGFFKVLSDDTLPCGPEVLAGQEKPYPRRISPVAVPPMVSFNTLPQAWVWKDWIARGDLGRNLSPSGDFEDPDALKDAGWTDESYAVESIDPRAVILGQGAGKSGGSLELTASTRDLKKLDSLAPFQDHPVSALRSPPIPVRESEMIRISVLVSMPTMTTQGAGGLIVRDSIGGEPLQYRTAQAVPGWQEVVLYRRAPADGEMTVLLGYAGLQYARFDNFRVQKITGLNASPRPPVARAPAVSPRR